LTLDLPRYKILLLINSQPYYWTAKLIWEVIPMFCPKCGAQNPDTANFCQACGIALAITTPAVQSAPLPYKRTSGLAVASLVLGILGFFNPITPIMAIIFGGLAMGQTVKDKTVSGHGIAVAGLVTGIVGLSFWAVGVLLVLLGTMASISI
jgi:hypothetical protein